MPNDPATTQPDTCLTPVMKQRLDEIRQEQVTPTEQFLLGVIDELTAENSALRRQIATANSQEG